VKFLAVAERRVENSLLFVCLVNTPAPKKYGYSRLQSLSGGELKSVRGRSKKLKTRHLSAYIAASALPYGRVSVVVGKHGHTIVERNRLRRRLRELVRVNLLPACTGTDIVLHALPEAYDLDFGTLDREVHALAGKLEPGIPSHL